MSKVSFREIVTMKTVEPVLKEGIVEWLLQLPSKDAANSGLGGNRISGQGTLVRTSSLEDGGGSGQSVQQIQHQATSIDQISSSVCGLQDSMAELKSAFTALRIELNGSGLDGGHSNFEMVSTVLKELRCKSEEIEKLKLEIEALKFKNRYMEEQALRQSSSSIVTDGALPEIGSHGLLLQNSRKRPWPDSSPSGRTQPIADSFDDGEDDILSDDGLLTDTRFLPMKIPLKDPGLITPVTDEAAGVQQQLEFPRPHNNTQSKLHSHSNSARDTQHSSPNQVVSKRPRLSQPVDLAAGDKIPEKRRPGRPRKSTSQVPKPDTFHTPKLSPLGEQNGNTSVGSQKGDAMVNPSPSGLARPNSHRAPNSHPRNLRSRSRARSRSMPSSQAEIGGNNASERNSATPPTSNIEPEPLPLPQIEEDSVQVASANDNSRNMSEGPQGNLKTQEAHRSQVASRDLLVKLAMQREEAMETEGSR